MLKGSGSLNVSLLNTGTVSPGYSPGVDSVASYTQISTASLQIELGGTKPGTGANQGFHDQLNVAGMARLDGTLEVKLIENFHPKDGDTFTILTFGALSGSFAKGTGLLDVGDGLYFEIKTTATALQLVAHKFDESTAFVVSALSAAVSAGHPTAHVDLADRIGLWLNYDYFKNNQNYAFDGSLSLGNGLTLSGSVSLGYASHVQMTDADGVQRP